MIPFITALHVLLCLFLIVVVLLQTGKGSDMGAAFGGASQTVFGATGAVSLLGKVTTVTAVLFMLTSMTLAWHSSRAQAGGGGLDRDQFDREREQAEQEAAEEEATDEEAAAGATTPDEAAALPALDQPALDAVDDPADTPAEDAADEPGPAAEEPTE